MTTRAEPPRGMVVLVHGFGSSAACWDHLLGLLRADQAVSSLHDFSCFSYPTRRVNFNLLQRIPRLKEVARELKDHLDSDDFRNREITLVGHSLGGLVIHFYIAHMLSKEGWHELDRIRQVVTLATPHTGSTTGTLLRRVISMLVDNPQERSLRVLDPETAEIVATVVDRSANTTMADNQHWPIPVSCFGGLGDAIVPEASAKGPFKYFKSVKGDHFTILEPEGTGDERYRELVEVLLDPVGHPHVFEVAHYRTTVAPRPFPERAFKIELADDSYREGETDNVCQLTRTVRFAQKNQCLSRFKIRYLAFSGSCFEYKPSHPNEAGQLASEYEHSNGTTLDFKFTPRRQRVDDEYKLCLKIYNGFGVGRRDVHFHLGPESNGGLTFYRHLVYELDLSRYLKLDHTVTVAPTLYWNPEDPGVCKDCKKQRTAERRVQPVAQTEEGVWRWEFVDIRSGVVDLLWDVAKTGAPEVI